MKEEMETADVSEKRFCPCCGYELNKECWKRRRYHCPLCGLEGTHKQSLDSPDRKVWNGSYDEDWLWDHGYDIMTSPEEINFVGLEGFKDNAWLIADEEGMTLYGRYSYVYKSKWFKEAQKRKKTT